MVPLLCTGRSPAHIIAILPALILFRASSPSTLTHSPLARPALLLVSIALFVAAWLAGVVGFVTSVITLTFTPLSSARHKHATGSATDHFQTPHGIAGLVIFALVYFVLPLGVAAILVQDYHEEHKQRHSRVSNTSSTKGKYKDDPTASASAPTPTPTPMHTRTHHPRQSSNADKLVPLTRCSIATMPDLPNAEDDPDGDPISAGKRIRLHLAALPPACL